MKGTEKSEEALKEALSKYFKGHGQRLKVMSKLILSLLKMSTVNFAQLALVLNPIVKTASNFKRIQRFVKEFSFSQKAFVDFAWSHYGTKGQWIALSMDRTNWKFGRVNINILTIGISWRGTAIPLVWMMLDKRGNSNGLERVKLLGQLLGHLDEKQKKRIHYLLMDREFASEDWLTYLKKESVHFIIRIRKDAIARKVGQEKGKAVSRLFGCKHFRALRKHRILFKHRLYLGGQQLKADEYFILISDLPLTHGRQLYGERWGIEVFFGACKKRGFNFEDTHLTKLERIDTLLYLLAIAFIWAMLTGEFLLEKGHQIPIKQLKGRKAKLVSIFRLGLDSLKRQLLNFMGLKSQIQLLSCT